MMYYDELLQWARELWQWGEAHGYPCLVLGDKYRQGGVIHHGREGWDRYFNFITVARMQYVADRVEAYKRRHHFTEKISKKRS